VERDFVLAALLRSEAYTKRLTLAVIDMEKIGYEAILYYLSLPNEEMAVQRVQLRVAQGGHNVPVDVVKRRYHWGWKNFLNHYKELVDTWVIFDNSGNIPKMVL
jgi:predicted ABC-type ATPase